MTILLAIGGAIASFLGVKPWMVTGVMVVGLALGAYYTVSSVYNGIWQSGYDVADNKWKAVIAAEKERIREENAAALNESRRRIAELNALLAKLEEDLANAEEEARTDPNANRVCLGADSVRRLNKIH